MRAINKERVEDKTDGERPCEADRMRERKQEEGRMSGHKGKEGKKVGDG